MKLILAQGNPSSEYAATRHNVGWLVLERYATSKGAAFRAMSKFKADIAELVVAGEKVLLAKPTTFYNLTGEAAQAIASFYKISPEDTLVIHDELALDFGVVRTRRGGSDAGNNGIKSITAHLGLDTARLRIGIARERPAGMSDADFVLSRLSADELDTLDQLAPRISDAIDAFIAGEFEATTHRS